MTTMKIGRLEMIRVDDPNDPRGYRVGITHADPLIEVSAEIVASIAASQKIMRDCNLEPWVTLDGGVLTFYPCNRDMIIYREVSYDMERDTYLFMWPD